MDSAKLFKNGSSQAVRLPKKYNFDGSEVYIKQIGNLVVLIPKSDPWSSLEQSLDLFDDDFMSVRAQPQLDDRESF